MFEAVAAGWEVLLSHALPIAAGVLLIGTAHRFEVSTVKRTLGVAKKVIVDIPQGPRQPELPGDKGVAHVERERPGDYVVVLTPVAPR